MDDWVAAQRCAPRSLSMSWNDIMVPQAPGVPIAPPTLGPDVDEAVHFTASHCPALWGISLWSAVGQTVVLGRNNGSQAWPMSPRLRHHCSLHV